MADYWLRCRLAAASTTRPKLGTRAAPAIKGLGRIVEGIEQQARHVVEVRVRKALALNALL